MAKNLLIDTCVWRELISPIEYNDHLRQLSSWIDQSEIILFCPEVLKDEWAKHRLESEKRIEKAMGNHVKDLKKSQLFGKLPDFDDFEMETADRLLKSQIAEVDRLLSLSIFVQEGDEEVLLARKHKREKKAPFLIKGDSQNDAVLIFSTLSELIRRQENELYFFSSNHNEFGDLDNPKSILHPDISGCYPGIKVQYFADLHQGIDHLKGIGLTKSKVQIATQKSIPAIIAINRKLSAADQLKEYLDKRFEDISFLPKKMIINHHPFLITNHEYITQQPFTATTDNIELLEWFKHLATKDGVYAGDIEDDTNNILRCLRGNLIAFVATEKQRFEPVQIPMPKQTDCDCSLCMYRAFRFKDLMDLLSARDNQQEPALKKAYVHYKMGQYRAAFDVLAKFSEEAISNKQYVSHFIAQFNIIQIGKLIKYEHDDTPEELSLIEQSEKIDLEKHFLLYANRANNDILLWIKDLQFVRDTRKKMQELIIKIRDLFYSQSSGWNNLTRELLNIFQETLCFLEYNHLIFDRFYEVRDLTKIFIEGVFASYGCKNTLGGKLIQFSDSLLEKIILNANTKDITEMYQRYKLEQLNYGEPDNEETIVQRFSAFLKDYDATIETYKDFDSEARSVFWSGYRRIFYNFVTFFGILDIGQSDFDVVFETLMSFLKTQQHLNESELTRTLRFFINHKAAKFRDNQLEDLLYFALSTDSIDTATVVDIIGHIMDDRNQKVIFPTSIWKKIQDKYLTNDYLKENYRSIDVICTLYSISSAKSKKAEISKFIKHFLQADFNDEVYYTTVMYDVIAFNKKWHAQYISSIAKRVGKGKGVTVFKRKEYYNDSRIDAFINYMIKFGLPIDSQWISHFKQLDAYYSWLLDMENFNYSLFDSEWLFNHLTIHYTDKFRKSTALKKFLKEFCKQSQDIHVLRLYIDLYD
ncbi:PIN domain-containing protein [Pedobacter frigoris]|uniref:PIN domain-containing protein n=1 Tax=Pedobacter frigoris TaxID=2571272 RepID=UPI00292D5ABD|nr:PIN domain-containing protein [Pedobacter frigoris]